MTPTIDSPASPALGRLADRLREAAGEPDREADWPARQLDWCMAAGVGAWFVPREYGGLGWSDLEVARGYLALGKACLTTAFILTQRAAATARLAASSNERLKAELLPRLAGGAEHATVAISHLSTSRRHLGAPSVRATPTADGYTIDGCSAWVTGAERAETTVVGATLDDGREILVAVPAGSPGLTIERPARLVGLSGSRTGGLRFDRLPAPRDRLVAGPIAGVMRTGGSGTGGLQTSTLALALADAALDFLERESLARANLVGPLTALREEWRLLEFDLLGRAAGRTDACSPDELRTRANSLVLRSTQAALVAAKGTGYVVEHPAGRWCREALFFLVWSCPPPVTDANLCELAGLGGGDGD